MTTALFVLSLSTVYAATRDANPRSWRLIKDHTPPSRRYLVEYRLCLLTSKDTIKANELSNKLNAIADERSVLVTLEAGTVFDETKTLVLRYHSNSKNIHYEITPEPVKAQAYPEKNEVHFFFDKTDMLGEIPFVTVRARIETGTSINPYETLRRRDSFLKDTAMWPTKSNAVSELLALISVKDENELTTLESVLHWLKFESGVELGVEPKGKRATRYGVKRTLENRQGNCWDYSDLFVTLCRRVGLPCRQVAGWQKNGGGHIWAEVYLNNIGWIQVNPTTGRTIDENYIPLFTTSDGNMSFVYRSFPIIKELKAEQSPAGDVLKAAPEE